MFGAKLKKWIEIVNPRKKSNKKKNGNSGNIILQQHSTTDYKGAVFQNEATTTTTISSPARRSEISPIQIHNGRKGWHSPNQEIPTTANSNKLNCPPPIVISNSNDTHQQSSMKNCTKKATKDINNYLPTAPTNFFQMNEIDQSMTTDMSSVNFQNSNKNDNHPTNTIPNANNIINNNNNSYNTLPYKNSFHSPSSFYCSSTISSTELLNDVHTAPSTLNNSTKIKNRNDSNANPILMSSHQKSEESKYGKIQPINKYMSKYRFFSKTSAASSTIDQYNGNSSDDFYAMDCSVKSLPRITTKNSLPPDSHLKIDGNDNKNLSKGMMINNSIPRNTEYNNSPSRRNVDVNKDNSNKFHVTSSSSSLKPPPLTSFAPVKQQNNSTTVYHQQNTQNRLSYHIINHVSSPESAYSTGYSTDGNSPGGCSNTTDSYYINIRTGIHYFPKTQNVLPYDFNSNHNRFKSDLNKIEEKNDEIQAYVTHKRAESFDIGKYSNTRYFENNRMVNTDKQPIQAIRCQSPVLRKNILDITQLRTPSPRQRSRIRTNPWISKADTEIVIPNSSFDSPRKNPINGESKKRDRDSTGSTTSSGIIISRSDSYDKKEGISDSESSSTEKPSKILNSPRDFLNKLPATKKESSAKLPISISTTQHDGSDEDATLNEIGKFDESYIYEKENDILSDSDRTDCVSDLGQEAEDECESTDDILDSNNRGKKTSTSNRLGVESNKKNEKNQEQLKKKKKFVRKRSKNLESVKRSPIISRGCRSVGGTPISIRRNEKIGERKFVESSLTNRSNSLTFNEVYMIHNRMLAISNSEKALIKADLEADVKYRQLIHEAESILISMKSNLSVPKEPISTSAINSPRKNLPTNKRVEMLRNCEIDLKRELAKTCNKTQETPPPPPTLVNKRLEMIRYDTPMSAPTSPKSSRITPIKTHLTNFIVQNERDVISSQMIQKNLTVSSAPFNKNLLPVKKNLDSDSETDVRYNSSSSPRNEMSVNNNIPLQFRTSAIRNNDDMFLPQSEPLKRKIYLRNSKIENVQNALKDDSDSDFPKKALLHKIELLRKERQQKSRDNRESSSDAGVSDAVSNADSPKRIIDESFKRKLIMKTIEDIKRSLEDQSLELNELHDSDT